MLRDSDEREGEELPAAFIAARRRLFWAALPLVAVCLTLLSLAFETHHLGLCPLVAPSVQLRSAAIVLPGLVLAAIAWLRLWRCPACGRVLGLTLNPGTCRACHGELQSASQQAAWRMSLVHCLRALAILVLVSAICDRFALIPLHLETSQGGLGVKGFLLLGSCVFLALGVACRRFSSPIVVTVIAAAAGSTLGFGWAVCVGEGCRSPWFPYGLWDGFAMSRSSLALGILAVTTLVTLGWLAAHVALTVPKRIRVWFRTRRERGNPET